MNINVYVVKSLELHLFFLRIMKEHSFFLRAGFTPANEKFSERAEMFKVEFEKLLTQAVELSNGIISQKVLDAGEIVTEFTALAEQQSQRFTGIDIDTEITARELQLRACRGQCRISTELARRVRSLNRMALNMVERLISFKETILRNVINCQMFTGNYPLLIEHITREARLYRNYLQTLERRGDLPDVTMKETECFWNQIMMEHAMFIRGLLDPSEEELFRTADGFAREYAELLEACDDAQLQTIPEDSLEETLKFRDFKAAGAAGIQRCKIRSVILPLLADHVLREANHYLRLLGH